MWIPEWLLTSFWHLLTYVAGLFTREFVKLAAPYVIPKKPETDKISVQITDGGKKIKEAHFEFHNGAERTIKTSGITDDTDIRK